LMILVHGDEPWQRIPNIRRPGFLRLGVQNVWLGLRRSAWARRSARSSRQVQKSATGFVWAR
jgi:hypothetical protein